MSALKKQAAKMLRRWAFRLDPHPALEVIPRWTVSGAANTTATPIYWEARIPR